MDLGLCRTLDFGLLSFDRNDQRVLAQVQCLLDGFRQPRPDLGVALQAVDDDFDVVLDPAIELQVVGEANDTAVDACAEKAAFEHVLEQVFVFALLAADHRSEDEEPRSFRQRQDTADDLFAGLGGDWATALGAMSLANPCVEHAEEIVDFGDRADGRARITTCRLLLNADCRRKAGEIVHVGLLQLAKELASVA